MSVVLQTLSSYDSWGFSKACKPHTPLLFVGHGAVQLRRKGLQESHFEYKDTDTLKVQGWEKRCYADSKHRKLKIKAGFKVRSINRGNPPKHSHPIPSLSPYPHCLGTGSVPACRSAVSLGKESLRPSSGTLQALRGLMAAPCPHSSSFPHPALESSSLPFSLLLLLSRPLDNVTRDFSVCKRRAESFQLGPNPRGKAR